MTEECPCDFWECEGQNEHRRHPCPCLLHRADDLPVTCHCECDHDQDGAA